MVQKDEAELKRVLGEEYDDFIKFRVIKDKAAKRKNARQLATDMISENGKYHTDYSRLDAQLNGIWEKAMREANKAAGIEEEEEGE